MKSGDDPKIPLDAGLTDRYLPPVPMTADELRDLRAREGITQAALAARLGVHTISVTRWETGVHKIAPHTALAIKSVLSKAERKTLAANGRNGHSRKT